jgi:hypothetical protein
MSERERLLPCSYYEFTNPVGLVVRVTLHWLKLWSVSEMCYRHNTPTDSNLLACHIKFVWNMFNVTIIRQRTVLQYPEWHIHCNALIYHITCSRQNGTFHFIYQHIFSIWKVLCLILTAASMYRFTNHIYICPFQWEHYQVLCPVVQKNSYIFGLSYNVQRCHCGPYALSVANIETEYLKRILT